MKYQYGWNTAKTKLACQYCNLIIAKGVKFFYYDCCREKQQYEKCRREHEKLHPPVLLKFVNAITKDKKILDVFFSK